MLRNMLVVLLLVFEASVTGVTKMAKLWFLLIFLLWVIDTSDHHIPVLNLCTMLLYDKHHKGLTGEQIVTFLP